MNYIIIALLIVFSVNPLSYAKFNWGKKQYFQSIGVVFMTMVMVGLPIYVMLSR